MSDSQGTVSLWHATGLTRLGWSLPSLQHKFTALKYVERAAFFAHLKKCAQFARAFACTRRTRPSLAPP